MAQEDTKEYALVAARAIDEKKGTDIVIQDVSGLLKVTDYFVIATGANNRRVDAIAEEVEDKLREQCGIKPISREGKDEQERRGHVVADGVGQRRRVIVKERQHVDEHAKRQRNGHEERIYEGSVSD